MSLAEAKETLAAATTLRAALLRMRGALGIPNATANHCEQQAGQLLSGAADPGTLTDEDRAALAKNLAGHNYLNIADKISGLLADRTMQFTEIWRALLSLGVQNKDLKHTIRDQLSAHNGSNGRRLFIRVRHGWYRNRRPNDGIADAPVRLAKNELCALMWQALGSDALNGSQLMRRMLARDLLPLERAAPEPLRASLANNCGKGLNCFKRHSTGVYSAIPGRRPLKEVPQTVAINALVAILGHGPMSDSEIHERFVARGVATNHPGQASGTYVRQLLKNHSGKNGRRLFHNVSPRVFALAIPPLIDDIAKVLGTGVALSPAKIRSRLADLGRDVTVEAVRGALKRHSYEGQRLKRLSRGLYVRRDHHSKNYRP